MMSLEEMETLHAQWLEMHGPNDGAVIELAAKIKEAKAAGQKEVTNEQKEAVNEAGEGQEGEEDDATA